MLCREVLVGGMEGIVVVIENEFYIIYSEGMFISFLDWWCSVLGVF